MVIGESKIIRVNSCRRCFRRDDDGTYPDLASAPSIIATEFAKP
jgi:hypothetical protein